MGMYVCQKCEYAFESTSIEEMPDKCPGCGCNTNYNDKDSVKYEYYTTIAYVYEKLIKPLEDKIKKLDKVK